MFCKFTSNVLKGNLKHFQNKSRSLHIIAQTHMALCRGVFDDHAASQVAANPACERLPPPGAGFGTPPPTPHHDAPAPSGNAHVTKRPHYKTPTLKTPTITEHSHYKTPTFTLKGKKRPH